LIVAVPLFVNVKPPVFNIEPAFTVVAALAVVEALNVTPAGLLIVRLFTVVGNNAPVS